MTTTTEPTIRYRLPSMDLCSDGEVRRPAVERLAYATGRALADAFPGRTIDVEILWHVSGDATRVSGLDDSGDVERAISVGEEVWEAWVKDLEESDLVRAEQA